MSVQERPSVFTCDFDGCDATRESLHHPAAPWASVDGRHVCPDHIAEVRKYLAQRSAHADRLSAEVTCLIEGWEELNPKPPHPWKAS